MSEHDEHEDAALSALYRRTAQQQPSPQLDARVLATARRRTQRQGRRWWLPLSTAAVMVLAVSLLWRQQQHDTHQLVPERLARMVKAPEASIPAEAPDAEAKVAESAPLRKAEERPAAKAVPRSAPATPPQEVASAEAAPSAGASAEEKPQEAGVMALSDSFMDLMSQEEEAAAPPEGGAAAPARPEAQKRRVAKSAVQPEPLDAWLKRIEALRSKGEIEAARRELLAFRQAYPEHALPKELQALLPEAK